MARIAVFGANGGIGQRVVGEALERGHTVTAVVRDPGKVSRDHENLSVTAGDVLDPADVSSVARGQEVLVSAVGGGDAAGHRALIEPSAESLVAGLHALGADAPRLIMVGGAGSLRTHEGALLWDTPGLPEPALQIMHAHGDALDYLRATEKDVHWTSLCPAATIEPGERTGHYRTGLEEVVVDEAGDSRISMEDYAVALLDEIEHPHHIDERFTVGY
ncbi:NAD(P)-dependent oxidoreductase [Streptomyces hainanensis]|uniref:NAD(P)-dependent oxidoreductase n=1 Tax=Streptomyces hainanensis TaxID=402648 RepID=A0A4R4TUF2_9ACTN|nr:NAD(P)H-binding protein [Streptomyces hainanensis]TDC79634.1 NAD(P)-dependent oxidoreductase [Streptomyces hainanensis]